MLAELSVRRHEVGDQTIARRVLAGALCNEPFVVGMFGDDVRDRFCGLLAQRASWPDPGDDVTLVATLGGVVVATGTATRAGACHLCAEPIPTRPADAPRAEQIDAQFLEQCRAAHLAGALPPHAHIKNIDVDPALHGGGVGSALMRVLLDELRAMSSTTAVLECLGSRASFYERLGFQSIAHFADPAGPDLWSRVMRWDAN